MKLKSHIYCTILAASALFYLTACENSSLVFDEPNQEEWQDITDTELPDLTTMMSSLTMSNPIISGAAAEPIGHIGATEPVRANSFEVDSFSLTTHCPRLMINNFENDDLKHDFESKSFNYCDYYLYPKKGQKIGVQLHSDEKQASLVEPSFHDFSNGDFLVKRMDKHVIRFYYSYSDYKLDPVSPDVAISIY